MGLYEWLQWWRCFGVFRCLQAVLGGFEKIIPALKCGEFPDLPWFILLHQHRSNSEWPYSVCLHHLYLYILFYMFCWSTHSYGPESDYSSLNDIWWWSNVVPADILSVCVSGDQVRVSFSHDSVFVMFFSLIRGCLADSCWPLHLSALRQRDVIYRLRQRTDVGLVGVVFIWTHLTSAGLR